MEWKSDDFKTVKPNIRIGNLNLIINFNDIKGGDVEWAMRYIASLASSRVFEGYEDGSFQPRKPISRIEAITAAVRLMGLRDKAESAEEMSTKLNFRDGDQVAKKYPWAVGYVAVALENDLFGEDENAIQPEKPADRLWATTLLVKALKLDAEAHAKMNTQLPFRDANKIPAGSVGYVAVAIEKGLIDGYDDNTFRPERPVTRAELAALLDRTGENLPGREQGVVAGKVSAISGNVLTINKDGKETQVTLDPATFVFRNGTRAAITDLQVGDVVKVRVYNNIAVFVEVLKASDDKQQFTVDGVFNYATWNNQGKIASVTITQSVYDNVYGNQTQVKTYNVAPELKIIGDAAKLVPNALVQLKGWENLVRSIEIK
ncbi:S-layer homology domain-containing protein [Paenibacillus sp. CC-CFT747]|nr:S-layer homology domain-containing protein [Paenibacillus sp. CC-CFT747]